MVAPEKEVREIVISYHWVIGSDGSLREYRWGVERKKALLEIEQLGREPKFA